MKSADASFDGVAADFYAYEKSVRGAIRYEITQENLARQLADSSLNIIDFYGGSGPDTAWAASHGHNVTLVESSADQLEIARNDRFPKLDADVRERITVIEGTLDDLPSGRYETYDAGFSHGVAMYYEDAEPYWKTCLQFIKPGGLFSILEKGFGGTAQRLVREDKIPELLEFLPKKRLARNNMGKQIQAFTFNDLQKVAESLSCEVIDKAGVRIVTDQMYQPKTDLSDEEWNIWLNEERRLARDVQEMHCAQMLHVIVRKK